VPAAEVSLSMAEGRDAMARARQSQQRSRRIRGRGRPSFSYREGNVKRGAGECRQRCEQAALLCTMAECCTSVRSDGSGSTGRRQEGTHKKKRSTSRRPDSGGKCQHAAQTGSAVIKKGDTSTRKPLAGGKGKSEKKRRGRAERGGAVPQVSRSIKLSFQKNKPERDQVGGREIGALFDSPGD